MSTSSVHLKNGVAVETTYGVIPTTRVIGKGDRLAVFHKDVAAAREMHDTIVEVMDRMSE